MVLNPIQQKMKKIPITVQFTIAILIVGGVLLFLQGILRIINDNRTSAEQTAIAISLTEACSRASANLKSDPCE